MPLLTPHRVWTVTGVSGTSGNIGPVGLGSIRYILRGDSELFFARFRGMGFSAGAPVGIASSNVYGPSTTRPVVSLKQNPCAKDFMDWGVVLDMSVSQMIFTIPAVFSHQLLIFGVPPAWIFNVAALGEVTQTILRLGSLRRPPPPQVFAYGVASGVSGGLSQGGTALGGIWEITDYGANQCLPAGG
jgi:hypothetical protein